MLFFVDFLFNFDKNLEINSFWGPKIFNRSLKCSSVTKFLIFSSTNNVSKPDIFFWLPTDILLKNFKFFWHILIFFFRSKCSFCGVRSLFACKDHSPEVAEVMALLVDFVYIIRKMLFWILLNYVKFDKINLHFSIRSTLNTEVQKKLLYFKYYLNSICFNLKLIKRNKIS